MPLLIHGALVDVFPLTTAVEEAAQRRVPLAGLTFWMEDCLRRSRAQEEKCEEPRRNSSRCANCGPYYFLRFAVHENDCCGSYSWLLNK